ncbi:MAG: hypothetical protein ACR2N5_03815 [Solirubrobacterales bacterium]
MNSATTADTAATADSATSAANADTLDGKDASELQTSSGYAQRTADLVLTAPFTDVVTTSVATTGTRIVATGSLELNGDGGGDDNALCRLVIAGTLSPNYEHVVPDTAADKGIVAITFAETVSPGTHPVELECSLTGGVVTVDVAGLSVVAVSE